MGQIPYNVEIMDIENFLSALYGQKFDYLLDRFRVETVKLIPDRNRVRTEKTLSKNAFPEFYFKIKNKFYRIDKDDTCFFLLPLDEKRFIGVDACENILFLNDSEQEDSLEYDHAINLSLDWIMFRSRVHPELIDDYIQFFNEKNQNLKEEKKEIDEYINYNNEKINLLNDLKKKNEKELE